jgi:hypothetical protein
MTLPTHDHSRHTMGFLATSASIVAAAVVIPVIFLALGVVFLHEVATKAWFGFFPELRRRRG